MKNLLLVLSLSLTIGAAITLNSCKKETSTEDDSVSAQDLATVMTGVSTTADDASASAGQVSSFNGKTQGLYNALCGATVVDTTSNIHQITITYDGTSDCFGVIRSGSITITLTSGTHWQDVGAQLTVVYNNLKITEYVSGLSYTVNGTHIITNELGGLAWKIAYGVVTNDSTIHRFTSQNMSITFPNGAQRTWVFDRSRKWSSAVNGSNNTITVTDYTQASGNVDVTGTNRYGNTFTNTIITPIAADNNVNCPYEPYQGETQHEIANRTATVTYGTNESGTPIGTPTVCGLGYFISYYNATNGHSASRFVHYW